MPVDKGNPADRLTHPQVTGAIVNVLRAGGIRANDMSDAVADVQLRVLKSLENRPQFMWPKEVENWKALSIRAAQTFLFDRTKKAKRRRLAGDEGAVVEEPDSHALPVREDGGRHAHDDKKVGVIFAEVVAESRQPALTERLVQGIMDEEDQAKLAKELGLTHTQVRNRVRAIRVAFRLKVSALGAGALALLLIFRSRGPEEPRYYPEAPVAIVHDATPQEQAAETRIDAEPLCRKGDWDGCMALLNDAADLDPEGEKGPAVQAWREQYGQFLEDKLRTEEAKIEGPGAKTPKKAPTPAPKPPKKP